MANSQLAKIFCPACGQESFLKRAPRYDGFTRVGETLACAACGHAFADEAAVPYREKKALAGFDEKQLPPPPRVFRKGEIARLCRYCANYVVNPFVQRCSRLHKEVAATDTCPQFNPRPEPAPSAKPPAKPAL